MSLSIFILLFLTLAVLIQVQRLPESRPCGVRTVAMICEPVLREVFRQWRGPDRVLEHLPPPGIDRQFAKTPASGKHNLTIRGVYARLRKLSS